MIETLFLLAILLFTTLYLFGSTLLSMPPLDQSKVIHALAKSQNNQDGWIKSLIHAAALRLSSILPMEPYRKKKISAMLRTAGMSETPEYFMAAVWVKTFLIPLALSPALLFLPILFPGLVLLAIARYFQEYQKPFDIVRKKREAIESELPRFVMTMEQELRSSRDVVAILDNYRRQAGQTFRQELDIAVADMKSGGLEAALTRLEARAGSARMSDVVRGLMGVIRGDDGKMYFQILAHDFKMLELQRLKTLVMKRPDKIKKYSMLCLFCFLAMYLLVMGMEIVSSMGMMF